MHMIYESDNEDNVYTAGDPYMMPDFMTSVSYSI